MGWNYRRWAPVCDIRVVCWVCSSLAGIHCHVMMICWHYMHSTVERGKGMHRLMDDDDDEYAGPRPFGRASKSPSTWASEAA